MGCYGGPTPKPHVGFSNSEVVAGLRRGRMTRDFMKKLKLKTSTTVSYINSKGKKCFVGNRNLKASQPLALCGMLF